MPIFLSSPTRADDPSPVSESSVRTISKYHHLRQLLSASFVERVAGGRDMPEGEYLDHLAWHAERARGQRRELCGVKKQLEAARARMKTARALGRADGRTAALMRKLDTQAIPQLLRRIGQYEQGACRED